MRLEFQLIGKYILQVRYLQWYTNTAKKKTGSIVVTDGNWHHIAVVKSNNILNFYIDGVVDGTGLRHYKLFNIGYLFRYWCSN